MKTLVFQHTDGEHPAVFAEHARVAGNATALPPDAMVLAKGPACPIKAIRIGDCAWGVQFHPEITPGLVTSWLSDIGNWEGAVNWLGSEDAAKDFAQESESHAAAARAQSVALYEGLRASVRKKR